MIPFSPIIRTPLLPFVPPMSSFAGIISGCEGRIPPSLQVISIGDLLLVVAPKCNVMNDEAGQPSGLKSGDHIFEYTEATLHSASVGYFKPKVRNGISIK